MGQRRRETLRLFFALTLLTTLTSGCERSAAVAPVTRPSGPRSVASLVPAATDMIIGMGARERLIAVSNWDADRSEIAGLARVGDYRTVDWEKLASLRPDVMIVQFAPDKMPPGLAERAVQLDIELVNLRITYLDDIFTALTELGARIGEPAKAAAAATQLRFQLDAVRAAVGGKPRVRTLISQTESPLSTVGGGNFVDDLLTIAGGENVIEGGDNSYPNIDVERLIGANPDVIIHLLPGESVQVVERAKSFWASHPQLSAVKSGRVHLETESHVLLPGPLVGKVAERFAMLLHPGAKGSSDPAMATMPVRKGDAR